MTRHAYVQMADLERRFDREWVLLDEPTVADDGWVTGGYLVAHSPDRGEVDRIAERLDLHGDIAIYFLGKPRWEESFPPGVEGRLLSL